VDRSLTCHECRMQSAMVPTGRRTAPSLVTNARRAAVIATTEHRHHERPTRRRCSRSTTGRASGGRESCMRSPTESCSCCGSPTVVSVPRRF
jgi:hypothetical protein